MIDLDAALVPEASRRKLTEHLELNILRTCGCDPQEALGGYVATCPSCRQRCLQVQTFPALEWTCRRGCSQDDLAAAIEPVRAQLTDRLERQLWADEQGIDLEANGELGYRLDADTPAAAREERHASTVVTRRVHLTPSSPAPPPSAVVRN